MDEAMEAVENATGMDDSHLPKEDSATSEREVEASFPDPSVDLEAPATDASVDSAPGADDSSDSEEAFAGDAGSETADSDSVRELARLREELTNLRAELADQQAKTERIVQMGKELTEFRELYPDATMESIPDAVWANVGRGMPVAAAYALEERRKARTEELAALSNRENRAKSSGSPGEARDGFFTQEEVRAMTQKEVRANYQKILLSMEKWH